MNIEEVDSSAATPRLASAAPEPSPAMGRACAGDGTGISTVKDAWDAYMRAIDAIQEQHRMQLDAALRALEDAAQEIDLLRAANHQLRAQVAVAAERMLAATATIHALRNLKIGLVN